MSAASQAPEAVRTLLLSLSDGQLILPYSVVQEIISWEEPSTLDEGPDWLLGTISWRRWKLPVISAERLAGKELVPSSRRAHVVVCSLMKGDDEMPCVGIVTQGVPQLVRAHAENVVAMDDAPEMQWAALQLMYDGAHSWVPDFSAISDALPRSELT